MDKVMVLFHGNIHVNIHIAIHSRARAEIFSDAGQGQRLAIKRAPLFKAFPSSSGKRPPRVSIRSAAT